MNGKANETLLSEVASYYSDKLAEYGETPRGVDWNGEDGQILRFERLCGNDLGCGYGAMFDCLSDRYTISSCLGVDLSQDIVRAAESRYKARPVARFIAKAKTDIVADYGIASGIFNVRLGRTDAQWHDYLQTTLDVLDRTSHRGFAFNCLTSYSDEYKKCDCLYYADPFALFDLSKRRYSSYVNLLSDYGLYKFKIIVRMHS